MWTSHIGYHTFQQANSRVKIGKEKMLLPPANEVWGKVICLQVCVCPRGGAWFQGVPGPGGVPASSCGGGACSRGVWPGECLGETPPRSRHPQTATAAGGTHPTGMHSCLYMCPQTPKIAHREGRGSAAFGQHLSHPNFDSKLCNG